MGCDNGRSRKEKCIPPITEGEIQWPMAVSIWKIGHPDLESAVLGWRGSWKDGHLPNIEWDSHTPGTSRARPWNGTMPKPGEIHPSGMPQGAPWPGSQGYFWGSPKISK